MDTSLDSGTNNVSNNDKTNIIESEIEKMFSKLIKKFSVMETECRGKLTELAGKCRQSCKEYVSNYPGDYDAFIETAMDRLKSETHTGKMEDALACAVAALDTSKIDAEASKTEAEAQLTRVAGLEVDLKEVCLLSYILYCIKYCQYSHIIIIQPFNSRRANYRKRVSFTMINGRRMKMITRTVLMI